jgi:hypothetical protein
VTEVTKLAMNQKDRHVLMDARRKQERLLLHHRHHTHILEVKRQVAKLTLAFSSASNQVISLRSMAANIVLVIVLLNFLRGAEALLETR